jgi:hypothetical protein
VPHFPPARMRCSCPACRLRGSDFCEKNAAHGAGRPKRRNGEGTGRSARDRPYDRQGHRRFSNQERAHPSRERSAGHSRHLGSEAREDPPLRHGRTAPGEDAANKTNSASLEDDYVPSENKSARRENDRAHGKDNRTRTKGKCAGGEANSAFDPAAIDFTEPRRDAHVKSVAGLLSHC